MAFSHAKSLKRCLIDYPEKCNYRFNESNIRDLRRCLFQAVSCNGKYYDWFSPDLYGVSDIIQTADDMTRKDVEWSFSNYDEMTPSRRNVADCSSHKAYHVNSPCARIFRRGEPIYRCFTCGFDETCALCFHCYQEDQHRGHNVHMSICQRDNGGVCDCGDPEAWVGQFSCMYASGDCSYVRRSREVPSELKEAFKLTIDIVLDFVIDVMSQSDSQLYPFDDRLSEVDTQTKTRALDPHRYGYNESDISRCGQPSPTYSLIAYNDQIRHCRDATQRIRLASKKVPEFAVMVAEQVQIHGRATVIRSRDYRLLQERQKILSATGLASCIRNSRDEFCENMCHEILLWLQNLTEREVFKSNESFKDILCYSFGCQWQSGILRTKQDCVGHYVKGKLASDLRIPNIEGSDRLNFFHKHWAFTPSLWNISSVLRKKCDYSNSIAEYSSPSIRGSRFQYFVFFDVRFWKSIRIVLHNLYLTSLITNLKFKKLFACQYVDIYPVVADMFLSVDGEPEVNVLSKLSSQLFNCPSHSSIIIAHGDVTRILSTIHNFLRYGQAGAPKALIEHDRNISMTSLKNRRWGQIFFDLGYILSRGKDRELILTDSIVPMTCDILSLFQGKPVLRREKEHHVEYESTDYTAFFHAISVVYQFAEYIAQSVTNLEAIERQRVSSKAIKCIVRFLLKLESHQNEFSSGDHNDVDYGRSGNSENAAVSFLHPIHSLLSWMIEYSNISSRDQLYNIIHSEVGEFTKGIPDLYIPENGLHLIFRYPVRTMVLSSQIKSGFWVRNGFSVRSQLQLYKSTSLREQGYLRDLFLAQVFTVCSDPDTAMSMFLREWLLYDWSVNYATDEKCCYESSILPYILEECLSFFIHILTEDVFLRGLSTETTTYLQIRSEIVHNLCFGPLTYSKLCSQIPEHIFAEKSFNSILEELAVLKDSSSSKDQGSYLLKDEYFDEVDPYYFNYTTNKKDDSMKMLKDRVREAKKIPLCDIAIEPKQKDVNSFGMFRHIASFTTSHMFVDLLIKILRYVSLEGVNRLDGLLETVLHLIHISSLENLVDHGRYGSFFAKLMVKSKVFETSLCFTLYDILTRDTYKPHHSKIRSIFKTLESSHKNLVEILSSHVTGFHPDHLKVVTNQTAGESSDERKKRMAKDRQAKLIAKFKRQQSSFSKINNVADEGSDMDMDDDVGEMDEGWNFPEAHCILCQDTTDSAGPFGIITYVSKASEFRQVPFDDQYWFFKAFSDSTNLNDCDFPQNVPERHSEKWARYMEAKKSEHIIGPGFTDQGSNHNKLVSSTCGHGMHFHCYMQYSSNNKSRSNQITRNNPDCNEHREFLCPLCKAINNMFIPILWSSNNRSLSSFLSPKFDLDSRFSVFEKDNCHNDSSLSEWCPSIHRDLQTFSILTVSAEEMIKISESENISENQRQFGILLTNMFQNLSSLTFPHILKADCPKILINSIQSTEISLRGVKSDSRLVISQLSYNNLLNLRSLNEFRLTSLLMKFSNCHQIKEGHGGTHVRCLSNLQTLTSENFDQSIARSDFFEILVTTFPAPSVFLDFNTVLYSCFLGSVLQSLNTIIAQLVSHEFYSSEACDVLDIPFSNALSEEEAHIAVEIFKSFRDTLPPNAKESGIVSHSNFGYVFFSLMLKSITPFLRRAAIYAYVCCANADVALDECLTAPTIEADLLCSYLRIPTLKGLLTRILTDGSWESRRLSSFKSFVRPVWGNESSKNVLSPKSMEYPGLIRLVDLPDRLDEFFTKYFYSKNHHYPYLKIENPAVCLFCAQILDLQKPAMGSPHGQCSSHFRKECMSSVGIFLLPKERCILLLHKNGGTFHEAPYLDSHGGLPTDSKKGQALYLSRPDYDNFIRNSWLQHNVPNLVVRKLDSVIDAGGWETL